MPDSEEPDIDLPLRPVGRILFLWKCFIQIVEQEVPILSTVCRWLDRLENIKPEAHLCILLLLPCYLHVLRDLLEPGFESLCQLRKFRKGNIFTDRHDQIAHSLFARLLPPGSIGLVV